MKIVCSFRFRNETPGALRYDQVMQDGRDVGTRPDDKLIGTLYLRKSKMKGQMPQKLLVTVEVVE